MKKLKVGDKVVITGINYHTEDFYKYTLVTLQEQNYPVTVTLIQIGSREHCFETPVEWSDHFNPGYWTLEYFYFRPYYVTEVKYLI